MKKIILFVTTFLISLTALCQQSNTSRNLAPDLILKTDSGNFRCYGEEKYKEIVVRIVKGIDCDTLQYLSSQLISVQDSTIKSLRGKELYYQKTLDGQSTMISLCNASSMYAKNDLKLAKKDIKKLKRDRLLFVILSGVLGVLVIAT